MLRRNRRCVKQKIYLRQTIKKSSSYFITELTSNNSGEKISALTATEHSGSTNNENNPVDSSDNLTTPQIHIENYTKKKEPKTLQPNVLVSTDPPLNSSLDLQNHSQNNKKKGGFEILDDSITSMKAYLLDVKIFFMDEILKIKERLKKADEMKCTDEIEHLRNENNSKSAKIKILLENLSILTNATYKHSQNETVVVENYDKNSANVPSEISKRTINVKNVKTGNAKDISDNKMVSPKRFESLSLSNDDRDDFYQINTLLYQLIL